MIYSDSGIKLLIEQKLLYVTQITDESIRPASICLSLGEEIITHDACASPIDLIDCTTFPTGSSQTISESITYTLLPKQFVLATTKEKIGLSKKLCGLYQTFPALPDWA